MDFAHQQQQRHVLRIYHAPVHRGVLRGVLEGVGCKCVSQGMSAATRHLRVELPPIAVLRKALRGWELGGGAPAPGQALMGSSKESGEGDGMSGPGIISPRVTHCLMARRPLGEGRGVRAPAYSLPALAILGLSRVPPCEGHLHVAQRGGGGAGGGRRGKKEAVVMESEEGEEGLGGKVSEKGAF